jgi:chromosome segregation ATPase
MLGTITDMCEENMRLRGDMDQLLKENTQLRVDIDEMRKMHTQLHDMDELQQENVQLRCDVDELQNQVRLHDTAMSSYMQLVARVENTMHEKEGNMNTQAMELQSRMEALELENKKLRRTVEVEVSSNMNGMQDKADERFIKLIDIANVFYKYIMGNITNSSVKRRLEKKGYLSTTTEPQTPDITPTNSQPTTPNTARFPI